METIVVATIGAIGVVLSAATGTRLGRRWRLLHAIQEEAKTHAALPPEMVENRKAIQDQLTLSVRQYRLYRESLNPTKPDPTGVLLILGWGGFIVFVSVNVLAQRSLASLDTWDPMIKAFAIGSLTVGALLVTLGLAMILLGVLVAIVLFLDRFTLTHKLARKIMFPPILRLKEKLRPWVERERKRRDEYFSLNSLPAESQPGGDMKSENDE